MSDRTRSASPLRETGTGRTSGQPPTRWLHAERDASDVDPFTFLAEGSDSSSAQEPRAYVRVGSSWAAVRGALSQIVVREQSGRDVCERVRAHAAARVGTSTAVAHRRAPDHGVHERSLRLYGGLAFHSRWRELAPGAGREPWSEFPTARFFLPAYELEGGDGQTTLRVRRRLDRSTAPATQAQLLEAELDRLFDRLVEEARARRGRQTGITDPSVQEIVSRSEWRASVERVREKIRFGDVEKVVLSRAVDLRLPTRPDPIDMIEKVSQADPVAHAFSFQFAPGAVFFGASPELLGSLRGREFRTMAVAGSAPRGEDEDADERLGRALRESSKDRMEHAICVRELQDRLDPLGARLEVQKTPGLHRLAGIQHLKTDLAAQVETGTHILDLLAALHPTAAVCGRPRDAAARLLTAEEPLSRGWYAGAVGWFDVMGDGDFVPGLRCAVLSGRTLRLFAGAGIVEASEADAEWRETSLKLETIGRALELGGIP